MGLAPELLRAIADLGFTEPTPIQLQSIPPALKWRDILGSAQTGSGKSAAFGLPILDALVHEPRGKTRALILAPTRELAEQISQHLTLLAKYTKIEIAPIYGGVRMAAQVSALKRGVDIIVATPGRLLDHMMRGNAHLEDVHMLVLDEADRMLDMGFLPDVRRILKHISDDRQTFFFSATLPAAISALVRDMLHDPVRVELAPTASPVAGLTQAIYSVPREKKTELLLELLKDEKIDSAIAFTRTKIAANRLAAALEKQNISVSLMHGDRTQAERTRALEDFKQGKFRILVATDIASRGIDIEELSHVINYDVPEAAEDYMHRVGRTARAQATGDAITFVSEDEESLLKQIEYALGKPLVRSKNPLFPDASLEAPKPMMVYRSKSRRR
ncbi:MAG: DEAD/DEAH box helicase [Candidatus Eremiobacteraeota bacterium]|nr:DEAD/DEAH box helicase [Candidatus Eremiobacteraeota bacterium]